MRNVEEVFAVWPATADLGRDLGVPYPTVSAWKQRGSIPAEYWRDVVRAARRRGHLEVTAEALAELHARRPMSGTPNGFAEERAMPTETQAPMPADTVQVGTPEIGHFSHWKHLRRHHFVSADEIAAHIGALREEWDRR